MVWLFLLCQENIVKSYHLLLSEHLSLQRNVANLLSSWTQASPVPVLPSKDEKATCGQVVCDFRTRYMFKRTQSLSNASLRSRPIII